MAPKASAKSTAGDRSKAIATTSDTAMPKNVVPPKYSIPFSIGLSLAILALAAVGSHVSQLNLSPVYGSIPSAIYHDKVVTFIFMLALVAKKNYAKDNETANSMKWIAPYAYYIPVIQFIMLRYSSDLGAQYGPLVTEAVTFFPVLLLSFLTVLQLLEALDLSQLGTPVAKATPTAFTYLVYIGIQTKTKALIPEIMGKADFLTRTGLQMLLATLSAVFSRSSMLFFAMPAVLHTLFTNPHHYAPGTTKALNSTLAEYRYSLLDRRDSNTGYISVLENIKEGYRALRCDHSILGGEWQITPERSANGQTVKETIYAVFTMLEAVRMIKTDIVVPDDERDALFIGLGIGTAPKAFIQHGINTTVVEIDPVVHEFATKYFDLPTNHNKVISDAVSWVDKQAKDAPGSYDYIVHDVFTGGAEPIALFTLEFLKGLDALLKEDGAIALVCIKANYAGDITLPPPRIVLNTIFSVFPNCKIFRDTVPDDPESFINMVVFCTKSSDKPIEFRMSRNEDYLDSMARRSFLPPDEGYEIKINTVGGTERVYTEHDILTINDSDEVSKYHVEAALRHWKVMRTVFPDGVWEHW